MQPARRGYAKENKQAPPPEPGPIGRSDGWGRGARLPRRPRRSLWDGFHGIKTASFVACRLAAARCGQLDVRAASFLVKAIAAADVAEEAQPNDRATPLAARDAHKRGMN